MSSRDINSLENVTERLKLWATGSLMEESLLEDVMPFFEQAARRLAARDASDLTVTAQDILQECYLRLKGRKDGAYRDRQHLMAGATRVMRHFIVDQARSKSSDKRGGQFRLVSLEDVRDTSMSDDDILVLHQLLDALAHQFPEHAEMMELYYFGGLSQNDIAEITGKTDRTVRSYLRFAKTWMAARAAE